MVMDIRKSGCVKLTLYDLYDFWYDKNSTNPDFILMCYALLQNLKPSYGDTLSCWKYDQLCDAIRYAMEDHLYDNYQ